MHRTGCIVLLASLLAFACIVTVAEGRLSSGGYRVLSRSLEGTSQAPSVAEPTLAPTSLSPATDSPSIISTIILTETPSIAIIIASSPDSPTKEPTGSSHESGQSTTLSPTTIGKITAIDTVATELVDCTALVCDDGNALTKDSCDPDSGCQNICDDGNACTREIMMDGVCQYVDDNNEPYDCSNDDGRDCIPGLINCSDSNPFTTDVCLPSTGCLHLGFFEYIGNLAGLDDSLEKLEEEEAIFYEEQTSLRESQKVEIVDWLQLEVTQLRTPFCWRRSYGRGVGETLNSCPEGKERIGLLCTNICEPGFSRQGTLDCHQICKEGWRDDGLFCRLAEYGRGIGYPWLIGDPLFDDSRMFLRCEDNHGNGNCEVWGLNVYPKCRDGYSPFGCCICRPSFDSCRGEGYTLPRIDLSCAAKIDFSFPTPLVCRDGLDQSGLLCYPECESGFTGVGPVCWQDCDDDQFGCVAGCARDAGDCVFALTGQFISPIIVAANLATLGASVAPAGAVGALFEIAGQLYSFATTAGEVMGWLARLVEQLEPDTTSKNAKVVSMNTGNTVLDGAVSATLFGAGAIMSRQFAKDFVEMTSVPIVQEMSNRLASNDLIYMQRVWAEVQFWELAEAEAWNLKDTVLDAFGVIDPTGIIDLINAYAKPVCADIFDFPVCTSDLCGDIMLQSSFQLSSSYLPSCQDVQVFASTDGNCEVDVEPMIIDEGASNPRHSKLFFALDPPGPFSVQDTPYLVELIVTDENDDVIGGCFSSIAVLDITPSILQCPEGIGLETDPGLCSATTEYVGPNVTNNCDSTSELRQTSGLSSGSVFGLGTTVNAFEVTDSLGNVNDCSFAIGVFDKEAPQIVCSNLTALLSSDPGTCNATYAYDPPVGVDNCEVSTVLSQAPSLDPFNFPLGSSAVEYTAMDMSGNTASCMFDVEVIDEELPLAECIPYDVGSFVVGGSDNCHKEGSILKAFVIDSGSGALFPTKESGLEYYEIGTTFTYLQNPTVVEESAQEEGIEWILQGTGQAYVIIEDEAGNLSLQSDCV